MAIRVVLVGLGPIGAAVAGQIVERKGFQIVGAVDIDPLKVGKDAGDVMELGIEGLGSQRQYVLAPR